MKGPCTLRTEDARFRAAGLLLIAVGAQGCAAPAADSGTANAALSANPARVIAAKIRECYATDRVGSEGQLVHLLVTVDGDGVPRQAVVAPQDAERVRTGAGRAFAESARRAALDPRCAPWPLPPSVLNGQTHTFTVTFRP